MLVEEARPASEVLNCFTRWPQLLKNVRQEPRVLETASVKEAIAAAERALEGRGRLLVRKSGTEPLIRVMAEGQDEALVTATVEAVCDAVAKAA